jgi:hypothetical protein
MLPGMISDIINWAFVLCIFYAGFSFGMWFIVGGDITEECSGNADLDTVFLVYEYMFYLLMGQSDWSLIDANSCVSNSRSMMLKVYAWLFALVGTTLLLSLVIVFF